MKDDAGMRLRVRLLAATCAALCTVPAGATDLERIDRESQVAIEKQMLKADPAAGAAALPPATSAEPRFRILVESLPTALRGKVLTPEGLARTHLGRLDGGRAKRASQELLQLKSVSRVGNGAQIVSFDTKVQGIEVFRRSVDVLIDGEQTLRAVSGLWPPVETQGTAKAAAGWTLRADDALAAALGGYGFDPGRTLAATRPLRVEGGYVHLAVAATATGDKGDRVQSARAKQVYFPLPGRLVPAWYVETVVEIDGTPEADYYAHVVSAQDGEILFRHHQAENASYKWNVWAEPWPPYRPHPGPHGRDYVPYPSNTPLPTNPSMAPASVVLLDNAPHSRGDDWLAPDATVTTGNNAEAYIDLNNDGFEAAFDFRSPVFPEMGPDPAAYDPALDPAASQAQREAAVRQMFYLVNWTRDWYYDAGFDEAAGNAQADNFGRGGIGNDSIRAEGQDNTGDCAPTCANNANMSTPADGGRPRMQMYTFSAADTASFAVTAPFAASYRVGLPAWSTQPFDVSGTVVQALDGVDASTDGCTALANAAAVAGKIAFVDRGSCDFIVKVQRAIDAGAIGVVIGNVAAGGAPGMGCTTGPCPNPAFPVLSLALDDANAVRSALGGGNVSGRLLRAAGVRPDGTVDSQIMAHELGHYISNRLVENANGLTTNMARGMGEGWADFHALLLTVAAQDINVPSNMNWSGIYPVATYSVGDYFYGLRRYPYSTNGVVNPLTLKHIQSGVPLPASPAPRFTGDNAQVHNTGEVWATLLWECYVALLRAHPFQEAQDRMKQYLIAGYKLTPPAPLVTEARDALMAAVVVNDPADFQRFAHAFARRGLGIAAQTPDRYGTTNAGTVESYVIGGRVTFGSLTADDGGTCDDDGVLDNGEAGVVTVRWNNTGWTSLSDSSLQISSDFPGLTFSGNAVGSASVASTSAYAGTDVQIPVELAGAPLNGLVTFTVTAFDPGLSVVTSTQFTLRVDYDDTAADSTTETFDVVPMAWTPRLTDGAIALKDWRQADASGRSVARAAAVGAAGVAWLESPDIAVGNEPFAVTLTHRHAFETDGTHYDGGVVELSTDGGASWNAIAGSPSIYNGTISDCCGNPLQGRAARIGNSAGYPAFTTSTLELGTAYAGQTVRLRFGLGEDEAVGTAGWDIDTVAVRGAANLPFPRRSWQAPICPGGQTAAMTVPGPVTASAPVGGSVTRTLAIGNQGPANLHWSIAESSAPSCATLAEIPWLRLDAEGGRTAANATSNVQVTLDAAGLEAGPRAATLCLRSNDPSRPLATVAVDFTVTNVAPRFTSMPVTTATEGVAYAYGIVVADPAAGEALTVTAVQKPAWMTFVATPGSRTASLGGVPSAADAGSHAVVLEVTDGELTAQQSFNVTVNALPGFTSTPVTAATAGAAYTYAVTVDDPNASDALTVTAVQKPAWLTLTATPGSRTATLSGTPAVEDVGSHAVTLRVTDGTLARLQNFTVVVNVAPSFTSTPVTAAVQASAYEYRVTASDANPGDVLAITAPTLPAWLTLVDAGDGTATLAGTPQLAQVGNHDVVLRVTDAGGLAAEQSFSIAVASNNVAPVAVGSVPAQSDDEGDTVSLDVSSAFDDANDDVLSYAATGLPPGLSLDAATGVITGSLDFASAGVYTVTVTATDPRGESATQTFAWTVNDVVRADAIFESGFEGN